MGYISIALGFISMLLPIAIFFADYFAGKIAESSLGANVSNRLSSAGGHVRRSWHSMTSQTSRCISATSANIAAHCSTFCPGDEERAERTAINSDHSQRKPKRYDGADRNIVSTDKRGIERLETLVYS